MFGPDHHAWDSGGSPQNESASSNLGRVLLLAGGPKQAPLVEETGHTILDLNLTCDQTVLDLWCSRLSALAPENTDTDVRIVTDAQTPPPALNDSVPGLTLSHRFEQSRYRGPVGVAMDECHELEPETIILLAEAGRLAPVGLDRMLADHIERKSDITVGVNSDRSPAGVYLLARSTLDLAPSRGFMDLKEQWLPRALSKGLDVHVHIFDKPGALPLRQRLLFLDAVRTLNDLPDPSESTLDPFVGTGSTDETRRSVVAKNATIAPDAVILDSVVMNQATIGSGAIVARSIVCPRGVVAPDETLCDAVLGRGGLHSSSVSGSQKGMSSRFKR